MPEITSPDAIRAKLREFDQQLSGALEAARVLERVKSDSERLVALIKDRATSAEGLLAELQKLMEAFARFKADTLLLKDSLKAALDECTKAQQLVQQKLEEAERRLITSVTAALDAQKAALSELDNSTRNSAEAAHQAKTIALERAARVESLVASTKTFLADYVKREFLETAQMLNAEVKRMDDHFNAEHRVFKAELSEVQAQIAQFERRTQEAHGALEQRIQGAESKLIGLDVQASTLATRLDKLIAQLKSRSFFTGVK